MRGKKRTECRAWKILSVDEFPLRRERGENVFSSSCRACRAEREKTNRKNKGEGYLQKERIRYRERRKNPKELASKNNYVKIRYHTDLEFKIKMLLSSRIRAVVAGKDRSQEAEQLLGCSIDQFLGHLEILFQDGMDWENQGRGGWHIDHKRPCDGFDLSDPEQQKACFNWKNLQPLWEKDNLKKGAKLL